MVIKMIQKYDLHIHTKNSDGELDVFQIVEKLKEKNIKYFSVTDHDNFDSVKQIENCDLENLVYLKGVEISSILDNKYKMHILGYNFDENNEELSNLCNKIRNNRIKRLLSIVDYVENKFGLTFNDKDIQYIVENVVIPGRPHLARLMLQYGYVSSIPEAFDKYLNDVKINFTHREDAMIVIDTIHESGGVAILAHPKKVEKKYNIDLELLMPKLLEIGLDGIEIGNTLHSLDDCKRYMEIAKKYNLLTSAGSDYHGPIVKPKVKLGLIFDQDYNYEGHINILKR